MTAPNLGLVTGATPSAARARRGGSSAGAVPIRAEARTKDGFDAERIALVLSRWDGQDALLAPRDRQIEENVRMLAGRQWEQYSPSAGRFLDITAYMSDAERAYRQRPVLNRLLFWFILTHARLTESQPVVSFQPSSADMADAKLAEVMDPIFKTLWLEVGMLEAIDRLMAWLIPAGQAYLMSRIDFTKGPRAATSTAPSAATSAAVPGGDPQSPFDANGMDPNALVPPDMGEGAEDEAGMGLDADAAQEATEAAPAAPAAPQSAGGPTDEREGALAVDVLSALEVRGEWNAKPWHEKAWHIRLVYRSPDEVEQMAGVKVEPDTTPGASGTMNGYLQRVLFSAGNFGAAGSGANGLTDGLGAGSESQGLVATYEMWEKPDHASPETDDSPGGRLLVVSRTAVLYDSARPFRLRGASPIRAFSFVNVPGRPTGTSPQEMLNPIQRAINKGLAQILEHRALMTNPMIELDAASGLTAEDFVSRPGAVVITQKRPGVDAFRFVSPPQLSNDVWRTQQMLSDTLDQLGNIDGAMGAAPTSDASGDLVKELRFNSDRFIGATCKRAALELARVAEDWLAMLPVCWTAEKIIAYAGEDNVARTVSVLPDMWSGKVNVFADTESMLPEGRGERQQKVLNLYQLGILGPPGSPEANKKYLDLSQFPHLSRATRPGGVDRITAEHLLGRVLQGEPAESLPLMPWYDVTVHLAVFEDFMKSPDYLKTDPAVRQVLDAHHARLNHAAQLVQQQATAAAQQQAMDVAKVQAVSAGLIKHAETAGTHEAGPPPVAPAPPNTSSE